MSESLPDGRVFKGADPETFEGLGATGLIVDQSKDQLTLAPRVGGAYQLGDALILHQIAQHLELLCFVLRNLIQPFLRHNGQILVPPLGISLIIGTRVRKLHKMPDTP